jgi:hypothetical protein
MTFNKKLFNKFHDEDGGMQVELGNEATYLVSGLGTISLRMPLDDDLDLHVVLFIPGLMKNLLYVSTMTNMKCVSKFDHQQYTIRDCSQERRQVLARGVLE